MAQRWERYDDGLINHSLGNFYFKTQLDQESTCKGLVLEVKFNEKKPITANLIPTKVVNGSVGEFPESSDQEAFLDYICTVTDITSDDDRHAVY